MSIDSNKPIVKKSKEILKELGYEVKTSHIYDLLSRLAGETNWHVASAKNVSFAGYLGTLSKDVGLIKMTDYPIFESFIPSSEKYNFQLFKKKDGLLDGGGEIRIVVRKKDNGLFLIYRLEDQSMGERSIGHLEEYYEPLAMTCTQHQKDVLSIIEKYYNENQIAWRSGLR